MSWEKRAINKVPFMAFDASEHHISHSELRVLGVGGTGLGSSDRPRVPIGATRTQSPSSLRYSRRVLPLEGHVLHIRRGGRLLPHAVHRGIAVSIDVEGVQGGKGSEGGLVTSQ